jgi:hypothetical protein
LPDVPPVLVPVLESVSVIAPPRSVPELEPAPAPLLVSAPPVPEVPPLVPEPLVSVPVPLVPDPLVPVPDVPLPDVPLRPLVPLVPEPL